MRIEIDTDVETARIAAALAEIKREGAQRKACYPKWVAAGKLDAAEARRRLLALADACRVIQAVLAEVEPLPFVAEGEGTRTAGTAVPTLSLPPLPYVKGASVTDEPPRCRFCGLPGERVWNGADSWRCQQEDCKGRMAWVRAAIFEGGVA